jgi:hypothetical protein
MRAFARGGRSRFTPQPWSCGRTTWVGRFSACRPVLSIELSYQGTVLPR